MSVLKNNNSFNTSMDSQWQDLFRKAKDLFQTGVAGDRESVVAAYQILENLQKLAPEDPLINAYYGSALCLLGRDLAQPTQRFEKVLRGLKILDQAVKEEPDNFEIRIIRGNICLNLPEAYFHQNAIAVEDFSFLVSYCEQNQDFLLADLYFQFLYGLGVAYQNLDHPKESEFIWQKMIALAQNPKYADLLKGKTLSRETAIIFTLTQSLDDILSEADKLHQSALTGDPKDLQLALDFFTRALALYGDNEFLKAYQTDCMSFSAKEAGNTGDMFAGALKATKILDSIINNNPDNIKLRLLRANHSFRLPESFFSRTVTAIIDLEYLVKCYGRNSSILSQEQYQEILFKLGLSYCRLGMETEASKTWQDLLQANIDSKLRGEIERQLCNLKPPSENQRSLAITQNRCDFYQEAKRLHDLGVGGNKYAVQMGLKLWQQAHEVDPADPLAEAYYGSSLALIGRDSTDTNISFSNAIQGMKHLSSAINRDPENWEIHLLRGYLAYSLPEAFFHTTNQALEDFTYLKKVYQLNNNLYPQEIYQQISQDFYKIQQQLPDHPETPNGVANYDNS